MIQSHSFGVSSPYNYLICWCINPVAYVRYRPPWTGFPLVSTGFLRREWSVMLISFNVSCLTFFKNKTD